MLMTERNAEFWETIRRCPWLAHCGEQAPDFGDFDVVAALDFYDAWEEIQSLEWENLCLDKGGEFTSYLSRHYPTEYNNGWNPEVIRIKREDMPAIAERIAQGFEAKHLPPEALNDVRNDIKFNLITIMMLRFYGDCFVSPFYDQMLRIYLAGRLPCGWKKSGGRDIWVIY